MSPSALINYLESQNRQHAAGAATPLRDEPHEPMETGPADLEPEVTKDEVQRNEDLLMQLGRTLKQSSETLPAVDLAKLVMQITNQRLTAHPNPPVPVPEDEEVQFLAVKKVHARTDLSAYPGLSFLPALPHPPAVKAGPRYAWPLVPEAEGELLKELTNRTQHLITGSICILNEFHKVITLRGLQDEDLEDSLLFVRVMDPSLLVLAHNGSACLELIHLMEHAEPGSSFNLSQDAGWKIFASHRPILMAKLLPLINVDTLYSKVGNAIKEDFSSRFSLADIAGFKSLRRCLYLPRILKLIQLFTPRAGSPELIKAHQDRCPHFETTLAPYNIRLQRRETMSIEKLGKSRQVLSEFFSNAGTPEPDTNEATRRKLKQLERKNSTDSNNSLRDADRVLKKKKPKKVKRSKEEKLERKKNPRNN